MNIEWKPVNPCPCGAILYPDSHKCNAEDGLCHVYARYEGKIAQAKQLLEYQIKTVESNLGGNLQIAVTTWLKSMLKELEEK
jgi:hypothetical protein